MAVLGPENNLRNVSKSRLPPERLLEMMAAEGREIYVL